MLKVYEYRCPQNHQCPAVRVCPTKAISQVGVRAPEVNQDACVDCGKCVYYCPTGALMLEKEE